MVKTVLANCPADDPDYKTEPDSILHQKNCLTLRKNNEYIYKCYYQKTKQKQKS